MFKTRKLESKTNPLSGALNLTPSNPRGTLIVIVYKFPVFQEFPLTDNVTGFGAPLPAKITQQGGCIH